MKHPVCAQHWTPSPVVSRWAVQQYFFYTVCFGEENCKEICVGVYVRIIIFLFIVIKSLRRNPKEEVFLLPILIVESLIWQTGQKTEETFFILYNVVE